MEEETSRIMGNIKGTTSHWWWFDSHQASRRSPWLQSTLEELDDKTKSMLKIVEEDADSFAQRAEMYYKKRPELISMVEDFYRMHRSLAEKYDQLKSETGVRVLGSPFSPKYRTDTFSTSVTDQISDSHSEIYDPDDAAKSEVDDPDHEDEHAVKEDEDGEVMLETGADDQRRDELMELRDELGRIKQDNLIQREQLLQKYEEQRDVIKELRKEMESITQDNLMQREQLLQKDEEKREVMKNLRKEMESLKQDNLMQREQLLQKDEEKREVIKKLRKEMESIKQENLMQREHLLQKDEDQREVIKKLRKEMESVKLVNMMQREQLLQKDEEKREVIRQLSSAMEMIKLENIELRKMVAESRHSSRKKNGFQFENLKGAFLEKVFNVCAPKSQGTVVAI